MKLPKNIKKDISPFVQFWRMQNFPCIMLQFVFKMITFHMYIYGRDFTLHAVEYSE